MFVYKIYTHTASEPNLLKMRLKQSVIERKARVSGPAGLRRHERLLQAAQRKQQKQNSTLTSTYNLEKTKPHSYPPQSSIFKDLQQTEPFVLILMTTTPPTTFIPSSTFYFHK